LIFVDTTVLVDVLSNEPQWADWSIHQLRMQSKIHVLSINPIIYAELSSAFTKIEDLENVVKTMQLKMIQIPRPALFLAAKAFHLYRKRGGVKHNVLGDFFIGAHAAVNQVPILTRDTQRYQTYFPTVRLITPNALH
jgi:predicted nucleic acid-binding protein